MRCNARLALAGAAAMLAAGCGGLQDPRAAGIPEPPALLSAQQDFRDGKSGRARDVFANFAASPVAAEYKWEALYWIGRCELELGRAKEAESRFEEVLRENPYPFLRVLTLSGLGAVAYSKMPPDYFAARRHYREASNMMRYLSDDDLARVGPDKILFFLGMCHWNLREQKKAEACFERVMEEYAEGDFARDAKRHHSRYGGEPVPEGAWHSAEVAVCAMREAAEHHVRKLAEKGFQAHIEKIKHERGWVYSVRVGRYNTSDEAEAMCRELEAAGIPAVVTP